jgi:hypothetical protein
LGKGYWVIGLLDYWVIGLFEIIEIKRKNGKPFQIWNGFFIL